MNLGEDMDKLTEQMNALQMLSPKLKPMSASMTRLIGVVKGIVDSIDEIIKRERR